MICFIVVWISVGSHSRYQRNIEQQCVACLLHFCLAQSPKSESPNSIRLLLGNCCHMMSIIYGNLIRKIYKHHDVMTFMVYNHTVFWQKRQILFLSLRMKFPNRDCVRRRNPITILITPWQLIVCQNGLMQGPLWILFMMDPKWQILLLLDLDIASQKFLNQHWRKWILPFPAHKILSQ